LKLVDDAVVQAFVQFGAAVDANGASIACGDGLHPCCVWIAHSLDFSKAERKPPEGPIPAAKQGIPVTAWE